MRRSVFYICPSCLHVGRAVLDVCIGMDKGAKALWKFRKNVLAVEKKHLFAVKVAHFFFVDNQKHICPFALEEEKNSSGK